MHRVRPIQFAEIEQRVPIQIMDLIEQIALQRDALNLIRELAAECDGTNTQHPLGEMTQHQHA